MFQVRLAVLEKGKKLRRMEQKIATLTREVADQMLTAGLMITLISYSELCLPLIVTSTYH